MEGSFEKIPQESDVEKGADSSLMETVEKHIESGEFDAHELIGMPPALHKRIVLKFIEAGMLQNLQGAIRWFQGLDGETALKLVDAGAGYDVADNLEIFADVDVDEVAERLLKNRQGHALARNLEKFPGLNHEALAAELIKNGQGSALAESLSKFHGLDHARIADELIESGRGDDVAVHLGDFEGLDQDEVAAKILAQHPRSLSRNLHNFKGLGKEIALGLLVAGEAEYVLRALGAFRDLDKEVALKLLEEKDAIRYMDVRLFHGLDSEVAAKLIGLGSGGAVAMNLDVFQGLDAEIARQLIEKDEEEMVLEHLDVFTGLDHAAFAQSFIDAGRSYVLASHLENFKVDHNDIARKLTDPDEINVLAENLKNFRGLDPQIADALIESGWGFAVAADLGTFKGLDHEKIATGLLAKQSAGALATHFGKFQGLDPKAYALKIIEAGNDFQLANNLDQFENLDGEVFSKLLGSADFYSDGNIEEFLGGSLDRFRGLDAEAYRALTDRLLMKGKLPHAIHVNDLSPRPDAVLKKASGDFGDFLTFELLDLYRRLDAGEVPTEAERFGVRHPGKTGMKELMEGVRGLRRELVDGTLDPAELLDSPIAERAVMSAVRYQASQWGGHDEEEFRDTIARHLEAKGELRPLPKGYEPSPILDVARVDKQKQKEFMHDKGFLARYGTLLGSIKEARELLDNDKALTILRDRLLEKRGEALKEIDERLTKQTHPKAIEQLQKQKETLERLELQDLSHPQKLFTDLMSFKGTFDEELRTAMFYAAYRFNPNQRLANAEAFDAERPELEELSWVLDFTDHITNQETMAQYFTDKEAAKRFRGLLNVSALEQEMARWQNTDTRGTMPLRFVPNRGLITEFSGHFSDACWASKYPSILKEFPDFIGLTILQNPDDPKDESIAGGAFLIEAQNENLDLMLVIRGLNPRENIINQLSPKDFFEKLVEYLKPMADKMGRKLAIVIDDHAGGAATNRPVLYKHLSSLKKTYLRTELADPGDAEFNGYDIRNDCYLIE